MTLHHHQAFLVMILESFTYHNHNATPAILIRILCFQTQFFISPLMIRAVKGSGHSGGFATKSVFHEEASRVSLMVMLMEIWHRREQWKSGNQPQQTQYDFLPRKQYHLDETYLILQYPAVYPFPKVMTHHLNRFLPCEH